MGVFTFLPLLIVGGSSLILPENGLPIETSFQADSELPSKMYYIVNGPNEVLDSSNVAFVTMTTKTETRTVYKMVTATKTCANLYYSTAVSKENTYYKFGAPMSHEELKDEVEINGPVLLHDSQEEGHKGEDKISQKLAKEIRVFCWILTGPSNHDTRAKHVKATWGKRCNKLVFMSSKNDSSLPSVDLGIPEGRNTLWGKTKAAFQFIYSNYLRDFDWFLKADDDTYIVMENLRYMLSPYSPSYPIYFGSRFRKYSKQGYMSGGAGYVLSREAVKIFVEKGVNTSSPCKLEDTGAEDAELGKCMDKHGVMAGDSRDSLGRGRFFPFSPRAHLIPGQLGESHWYWDYIYYKSTSGLNCCSDSAVAFHYVPVDDMYLYEYLIYHLRPFGIQPIMPFPPSLPPDISSVPAPVLAKYGVSRESYTEERLKQMAMMRE